MWGRAWGGVRSVAWGVGGGMGGDCREALHLHGFAPTSASLRTSHPHRTKLGEGQPIEIGNSTPHTPHLPPHTHRRTADLPPPLPSPPHKQHKKINLNPPLKFSARVGNFLYERRGAKACRELVRVAGAHRVHWRHGAGGGPDGTDNPPR